MLVIVGNGRYEAVPPYLEPDDELRGIAERIRARTTIPTGAHLVEYHYVRFDARVAETLETLAQVVGKAVISCSFGKDSLVLAHIAKSAGLPYELVYNDRGLYADLPETEMLITECVQRFDWSLRRIYPKRNMFQLYTEIGGIPSITVAGDHGIIKRTNLIEPMREFVAANGIETNIMGRRIEENLKTRGIHLMARGMLSFNQTEGYYTCDPLAHWTGKQIWAYIHQYDLPYHPVYDREADINGRERARMSNWCGVVAKEQGRFALLRRDYPELYNYLYARFPEVGGYT